MISSALGAAQNNHSNELAALSPRREIFAAAFQGASRSRISVFPRGQMP